MVSTVIIIKDFQKSTSVCQKKLCAMAESIYKMFGGQAGTWMNRKFSDRLVWENSVDPDHTASTLVYILLPVTDKCPN